MLTPGNMRGKLTPAKFAPVNIGGGGVVFARLGRVVAGHAWVVLAGALLVAVAAAVLGSGAFGVLKTQGFDDPASESSLVKARVDERAVLLVEAGDVDDPAVREAGLRVADEVGGTSYWHTGAPQLRSADGRFGLIIAPKGTEVDEQRGPIRVRTSGQAVVERDIARQVEEDLVLAEAVAVPLIAILLVIVFGGVVAASLPLVVGGFAILVTFAELAVLGGLTDVSVFAINLTTAMGLGLVIDYALLMVSRFREELHLGVEQAVVRTVETAGRTIVFSAATVAVALSMLLLFPQYFLKSFAYAGIGVVLIAAVAALVVLPALLKVLGHRVKVQRGTVSRFWERVATGMIRRPVRAVPVLILLAVATLPLLNVEFGTPDDRVLPAAAPSRVVGEIMREHFPQPTIEVLTTDPDDVQRIRETPGVTGVVVSPTHVTAQGDEEAVVRLRAELDALVGGSAAVGLDNKAAIEDRLPLVAGFIAVSTFVLLFLFTGSVVQPIRALLFNVITLAATVGVLVPIFGELDVNMLMLLFCIAFGLSMDYEVFVVGRIREAYDQGVGWERATVDGVARTGRIVSAAAVLLAISLFAVVTSGVTFVRMFGLGTGLAIVVDATLVRGVLLPAAMRLTKDAAWWAPRWLRRAHRRVGIGEEQPQVISMG